MILFSNVAKHDPLSFYHKDVHHTISFNKNKVLTD